MRSTLRRAPAAVVLAAALVGLSGCAGSGDEVRDLLADITVAANDRDADALRSAADDLIDELASQRAAGELGPAEADRLTQLAQQVRADADLIDQDALDAETARQEAEEAKRKAEEEKALREDAEKAADEAARKAEEEVREAEEKARELLEQGEGEKGKDKDKDDKKDDEQDDG